ncbi:hypothetical protein CEXT_776801 [Caerostris extrusa]|uniref:Uncharacterized protein n=1 Tax=Caerostris extrusa TaxID=172846 RepID=A0AAV4WFF8_CAEEX|nr:hypothetical protein CEXT_776801 [Caerostris extrusa]
MTHRNRNSPQSLIPSDTARNDCRKSDSSHPRRREVRSRGTRVPRNIPRESHWWVSAFVRREITEEERGTHRGNRQECEKYHVKIFESCIATVRPLYLLRTACG